VPNNPNFYHKPDASREGTEAMLEQEAVRRIITKSKLKCLSARTFSDLVMEAGFPYQLTAQKFSTHDLSNLLMGMRKWPTKTAPMMAFDEIQGDTYETDVGIVFPWQGFGGLHVFTMDSMLPFEPGTSGMYWCVAGKYYLLQHIDSFIARIGPPADW